jgi:rfaE bifunctional protein kinase chain/domain
VLRDAVLACDAALISDYGYGIVRPQVASALIEGARRKPVTLDSRYDLLSYPGVTAATPNEEEAAAAAGTSLWNGEEEKIDEVALTLQQSLDCEAVLITRGSRGMALLERDRPAPVHLPVWGTDQVADVTGAGDTVIATFTLALAAGASFLEAAKLANYAGGVVVMKMGTATVSNDELRHAIERDEELNG